MRLWAVLIRMNSLIEKKTGNDNCGHIFNPHLFSATFFGFMQDFACFATEAPMKTEFKPKNYKLTK